MFRKLTISLLLLFVLSAVSASEKPDVDSIMRRVMRHAAAYSGIIDNYDAEVYLKTFVKTEKSNFLYKYTRQIPNFVIHDPNNNEALIESVSKLRYEAPNTYSQDINYVTGTLTGKRDIALLPFRFISMDVYGETTYGELFFMPIRNKSYANYNYDIRNVEGQIDGSTIYTIDFEPKYKNPQLISGYFRVENQMWRILDFHGSGNDMFVDYNFNVVMGDYMLNKYLPVDFRITQTYNYLGNKVSNRYEAKISYSNISFLVSRPKKKNYNLGIKYKMRLDSVPLTNDTALWKELRKIPLSENELTLLDEHRKRQEERAARKAAEADTLSSGGSDAALNIMKNMVANSRYRFKSGDIRYSGLLNPSMLSYSTRDGISYRQRFAVNFDLPRQQRINLNFFGGYVFGNKLLSYNTTARWNYEPSKMGYLRFSAGRGNPSFSSRFMQNFADSLDIVKDKRLQYYKDNFIKLYNNIELYNGLQLGLGVDYHIRQPYKNTLENAGESELLTRQYHFVPLISLSWTPAQYYALDGNQKVYLRSDYPTFKLEYAQSINGVLGSKSSYNKIEFDINQQINFGFMSSLNYHAGFGMFTRQKNEYFNDFSYFAKSYFPDSWGDGIGGGFTVLRRRYYNTSSEYAQAHLMYETSKLGLTRINSMSRFVMRERLYASQLYTPFLKSYTEIGYGIGNRYVNAAFFLGFHKLNFENISARAAFLL